MKQELLLIEFSENVLGYKLLPAQKEMLLILERESKSKKRVILLRSRKAGWSYIEQIHKDFIKNLASS